MEKLRLTIYVRVVVEKLFNEVWKGEVGEDLQKVGGVWLRDSDHPAVKRNTIRIRIEIEDRIKIRKDQKDYDQEG